MYKNTNLPLIDLPQILTYSQMRPRSFLSPQAFPPASVPQMWCLLFALPQEAAYPTSTVTKKESLP